MARTNGIEGLLSVADTSTGAVDQTGFDIYHLINSGVGVFSGSINDVAAALDSSAFASSPPNGMSYVPDINSATMSFSARFPQGTPKTGAEGLVAFSNGYTLHTDQYNLSLTCSVDPGDAFASTPPTAREYVPGHIGATGSYSGAIDDTTAITGAGATGAATLRLDDDTTDNTFAGNIVLNTVAPNIVFGQQNRVANSFTYSGDITVAGSNPPLPAGVITKPDITEMVLRASGSRTFTFQAFWTQLNFSVAFGQLIDVSGQMQITGAITRG